tara:strand:+ start:1296 stop:2045 length:750 start_codon:yes stop_codon:yes gene_type:complete
VTGLQEEAIRDEHLLKTPEDVYGAIRKIVLMESAVRIIIDGSEQDFHSAITQTSLKNNSFFLDKVIPDFGNDLIRSGKRFTVECKSQGVHISFRLDGRLRYQPDNQQYRAELPKEVFYLQRRNAYRVQIPPAHEINVILHMADDGEEICGHLHDISCNGFKAEFESNIKKRLEDQHTFPAAQLRFTRENSIHATLEARHVLLTKEGHTTCGFAILSTSPASQRFIDRLITEFQWEERRLQEVQKNDLTL